MGWTDRFKKPVAPAPAPNQAPSRDVIEFLKGWESCSLTPYKDSAGLWTNGWGHLMGPTEPMDKITQELADQRFERDIGYAADRVHSLTYGLLTQARYDALVSFAFNVGSKALAGSTLLKLVNTGRYPDAGGEFWKWRNARNPKTGQLEVSNGLVKRRAAERDIFLFGDYQGRP